MTAARRRSLSSKLLLFTLAFVMLVEVLVFVPSIAFFRLNWLIDRLNIAQVAVLVAEAAPDGTIPDMLRDELLQRANVRGITLRRANQRRLILRATLDEPVATTFDLSGDSRTTSIRRSPGHLFELIRDALMVFVSSDRTFIRVIGEPAMGTGDQIEIVLPQQPLRRAMVEHARNVFVLSLLISLLTALAVYFTLNRLLVVPMMRLSEAMMRFSANPEDTSRIIIPSGRKDEIGTAETELALMQTELHNTLAQKSRLAALGLAVSKINHDLRNLLANALLLSDRLTSLPDPQVQRFAPKLIASLDRAIKFCNESLQFGRAAEPPPRREMVPLGVLVTEVGDGLGLAHDSAIEWQIDVPDALLIDADRDQLYRVLSNLVRNSVDAIKARHGVAPAAAQQIAISAARTNGTVQIDLTDNGPGLPPRARENMFQPFQSSTRRGGTGLGLAIAQEIIAAHGGRITLVERPAGDEGAHFRVVVPDRHV